MLAEAFKVGVNKDFASAAKLSSNPVVMPITEEIFMGAMERGWQVCRACQELGMKPYQLGGDPVSHGLGKLGEALVIDYLEERGYPVQVRCIRGDYKQAPESFDLQVGHLKVDVNKVDVKCANGSYQNGRLPDNYAALVPAIQAKKSEAHVFLWVFLDRLLLTGAIYGWALKEEVLQAPLRKDLKLPAYAVKIEDLHLISELEAML